MKCSWRAEKRSELMQEAKNKRMELWNQSTTREKAILMLARALLPSYEASSEYSKEVALEWSERLLNREEELPDFLTEFYQIARSRFKLRTGGNYAVVLNIIQIFKLYDLPETFSSAK